MKRTLFFLAVLFATSPAYAQVPRVGGIRPPQPKPATSPYLNLLRGNGRSFAFNYFQRVRPEQEFRQNSFQLNQSLDQLQQRVSTQQRQQREGSGLTQTGHTATFQNLGGYFPGAAGGGGQALRGGRTAPRQASSRRR